MREKDPFGGEFYSWENTQVNPEQCQSLIIPVYWHVIHQELFAIILLFNDFLAK